MSKESVTRSPIQLSILSQDAEQYASLLAPLPFINIVQYSTRTSDIECGQVTTLLADPNLAAPIIGKCHSLSWVQSTWAGNKPLLQAAKKDYKLTGVKSVFGQQMSEYVFAYILYFSRNIDGFITQQQQANWLPQPYNSLKDKTLGIIGAGSIADALIPVAKQFGMRVKGINRSGNIKMGYDAMYSMTDKTTFAKETDYVVSLLPDTPSTEHVIDKAFLSCLNNKTVLINAGRGSAIDDEALVEAIRSGQLKAAVLDVFREEPLPSSHPFWRTDNILITQHTAAESLPSDIADIFIRNAERLLANEPLLYQFDFDKGY